MVLVALLALTGCRYLPAAGDSPAGVVTAAFEAVEAAGPGGFAHMADFACAAKADDLVGLLGGDAGLNSLGVDAKEVIAGTSVTFDDLSFKESQKTETSAQVRITGKATYVISEATFRTIATKMLKDRGIEPTKKVLDQTVAQFADQLTRTEKMKFDVKLIQEDGKWVICP